MTLYLKYRPKNFDELDLESVRETLKKIVQSGEIPHALLFSGPKGLGKTSAARILAKALNCEHLTANGEPCNKCSHCKSIDRGSHMDVIELDAASNRGIDDIRAIREAVKLAPAMARKKVYIVDEAHMLTLEASNALLKTLEEPPAHVMFILATTNPEKLVDTVRSRTTNINFIKPTVEEITRGLKRVIKGEGAKVKDETLSEIIENSGSSFRDAVKLLESFILGSSTFTSSSLDTIKLLSLIFKRDTKGALSEVQKAVSSGVQMDTYITSIIAIVREQILANIGIGEGKLEGTPQTELVSFVKLLTKSISQMRESPIEQLPLEVAIIEWCRGENENEKSKVENGKETEKEAKEVKKMESKQDLGQPSNDVSQVISQTSSLESNKWAKILSIARPRNMPLEALLHSTRPISFDGTTLTLGVFYSFHKERLESPPHRQMLDEIIKEVLGGNIRVICTMTKPPESTIEVVEKEEGVVLTENMSKPDSLTDGQGEDIIKIAKEMFGN